MNEEALRRDMFLLVGYLLTSAHGLYGEPAGYGPFRLTDAAGRVLTIMEQRGLADAFTRQLERAIATERFGPSDDERLLATLNQLCLDYAAELKRRTGREEGER